MPQAQGHTGSWQGAQSGVPWLCGRPPALLTAGVSHLPVVLRTSQSGLNHFVFTARHMVLLQARRRRPLGQSREVGRGEVWQQLSAPSGGPETGPWVREGARRERGTEAHTSCSPGARQRGRGTAGRRAPFSPACGRRRTDEAAQAICAPGSRKVPVDSQSPLRGGRGHKAGGTGRFQEQLALEESVPRWVGGHFQGPRRKEPPEGSLSPTRLWTSPRAHPESRYTTRAEIRGSQDGGHPPPRPLTQRTISLLHPWAPEQN